MTRLVLGPPSRRSRRALAFSSLASAARMPVALRLGRKTVRMFGVKRILGSVTVVMLEKRICIRELFQYRTRAFLARRKDVTVVIRKECRLYRRRALIRKQQTKVGERAIRQGGTERPELPFAQTELDVVTEDPRG